MLPHRNIQASLDVEIKCAAAVGFNVFEGNFKWSLMSFFTVFDATTYILMTLYNIYEFQDDLVRTCFCMVTWTFGFQVRKFCTSSSFSNKDQIFLSSGNGKNNGCCGIS